MNHYLGVDFGTSSCRVAIQKENQFLVVPTPYAEQKVRDLLFVGNSHPKPDFFGIKQKIGFEEKVRWSDHDIPLIDLASDVFHSILRESESYLHESVAAAVVAVPSCFADRQRAALKAAAEKGGFTTVRLLDESIAAVLASDLDQEPHNILVYAMGSGVFTVSVLNSAARTIKPLWNEGNKYLGGHHFDAKLIWYFLRQLNLESRDLDAPAYGRLKVYAEKLKRDLSRNEQASSSFNLAAVMEAAGNANREHRCTIRIGRQEFEDLITNDIDETIEISQKAVRDAKLTPDEIDLILLVGGSTGIPLIRRKIHEAFRGEQNIVRGDLIAIGAAKYGTHLPEPAAKAAEAQKKEKPHYEEYRSLQEELTHRAQVRPSKKNDPVWIKRFEKPFHDAEALWDQNQRTEAIDMMSTLHQELGQYIANLHCMLGDQKMREGMIDEAISCYQKGIRLHPDQSNLKNSLHMAYESKAKSLLQERKSHDARHHLILALELKPNCPQCQELKRGIEVSLPGFRKSKRKR